MNDVSFKGKRVLIRVDFNVPLDKDFKILDDSRIIASLPTIQKVISDGGRAIILSHLGRPKKGFEKRFSLKHIVKHLTNLLSTSVSFCNDAISNGESDVKKMNDGDVLVLENLRFYAEESSGDKVFAKRLAILGDAYINDAFGTAHRKHSSTYVIAKFFPKNKYFGLLLNREVNSLKTVLHNPKRPFTAIIGGAKISGKIDVIKALFEKVDNLIIGGGMAYTFVKSLGGNIGNSLIEKEKINLAKEIITLAEKKGVNLFLPTDSINADEFKNDTQIISSSIFNINPGYMGLDIGSESIKLFSSIIHRSKTLVWNGPMGVFEMENFSVGTKKVGQAVSLATKNGAFSLVGGGDSIAAIKLFNLEGGISYISTGGGAMLKYLEGKELAGVSAIID